ncbi:hypothetical protein [Streptomyces sp. IBSBF 3136]|uniref:hypothetical protein n=1 Tax=Streptomyces sp. IBSBF 3136 TaxID=2903524 RepID=UPI002FDC56AD
MAILAYDVDFHDRMPTVFPARGEMLRAAFAGQTDKRESIAGYNAALQTGVFLTDRLRPYEQRRRTNSGR